MLFLDCFVSPQATSRARSTKLVALTVVLELDVNVVGG